MKRLIFYIALALSAFTFTATAHAVEGREGFAPLIEHTVDLPAIVNTVAIADCERCMYAGLDDKQPLIARVESEITAWTGPYEVGWRAVHL